MDNFLSNGVKYTKSELTVNVSLSENQETLLITVHDNGRGISPEALEKLQSGQSGAL